MFFLNYPERSDLITQSDLIDSERILPFRLTNRSGFSGMAQTRTA